MNETRRVDYSAYLAQPSDAEQELLKLFRPNAPLLICDIGCCEGEDSVRYARRFPNARLLAFEPLPTNLALARENLDHHSVRNVELLGIALSDRQGTARFHVSSGIPKDKFAGEDWNYGNKSSSLLPPAEKTPMYGWVRFDEVLEVATDTLDHVCEVRGIRHIDFIHLDVQGAEHLVLAGAEEILPHTTALWLEVADKQLYAGQPLRCEMEQFLSRRGFVLGTEIRREAEGDQFYVNAHMPRVWPYLAGKCLSAAARRMARVFRGQHAQR